MPVATFYDLAHRIATCPYDDVELQATLLEEVKGIRREWKENTTTELGGCMDAAVMLLAFIGELSPNAATESLQLVSRLVCLTAQNFAEEENRTGSPAELAPPRFAPLEVAHQPSPAVEKDVMLGEVLVKLRHVTVEDVQRALIHQRRTGIRLGQALVEIGAVETGQIQEAVEVQNRMRSNGGPRSLTLRTADEVENPKDSELRLVSDAFLGEILIRQGYIDTSKLDQGMLIQRATGIRIGEALVQNGAITWDQLEEALRLQALARKDAS